MTDWLNWSICSVCSMQRFASLLTRGQKSTQWRPTVTYNHWITVSSSHTHARTHTRTHNCPLMQRECVSKDKAISRSEYRQTEGIVFHVDTQVAANTHPHTNSDRRHVLTSCLTPSLDLKMKYKLITHRKRMKALKKGLKNIFLKVSDFQGSWTDERHHLCAFSNSFTSLHA